MATTKILVHRAFHCSGVSKMCNRSSFAGQREASSSSSAILLYWVSCINIEFEEKNSMKKKKPLLSHLIVYKQVCMGVRVCKRDIDANIYTLLAVLFYLFCSFFYESFCLIVSRKLFCFASRAELLLYMLIRASSTNGLFILICLDYLFL